MLQIFRLAPFRNAYLRRGLIVWGGLRLVLVAGRVPQLDVFIGILLLLAVAAVVGLDAQRRGEDLFLGNLGIPRRAIWLAALPLALIGEILLP